MKPLDSLIKTQLDRQLESIAKILNADALTIIGPILSPLDLKVRTALDRFCENKTVSL